MSLSVLAKGGVVYGCASLPGARIEHIKVETKERLELLKGSKYVQSNAYVIYGDLLNEVKTGRQALFIGTPCQVAAVKAMFKSVPDNLLLVDLVCHGVPSQKFLRSYLKKHIGSLDDVKRIWFRSDSHFQLRVIKEIDGKDKCVYCSVPIFSRLFEDEYYGTFFYGYSYRPSCYQCQFACPERCGDITIGDFWGLGKEAPTKDIPSHEHGISVILPNTQKGILMTDTLKELMNMYQRPVSEAINGNDQLRHPKHKTSSIRTFDSLRHIIGVLPAYRIAELPNVAKKGIKKIAKLILGTVRR